MAKQKRTSDELKDIFDEVVETVSQESVQNEEVNNDTPPLMTSPEWNDYVMSMFQSSELQDGNPKVEGLRRIAQLIHGTIIDEEPVVYSANEEYASVKYTFVFEDRKVSAVADSNRNNNVSMPFAVYPLAIAENRAMGRALRKVLNLRNVVSAEEIGLVNAPKEEFSNPISGAQLKVIEKMCKLLGIDILKFINVGEKKYDNIEAVSQSEALEMIQLLNRYQADDKNPDKLQIPEGIKL